MHLYLLHFEKSKKRWKSGHWCDIDGVSDTPVIQGYKDLLQSVGRSVKKNPPTVLAYSEYSTCVDPSNINSIIDIYNVESLHSLCIGGHDLDKIAGQIEFTVGQKKMFSTDFIYGKTRFTD